MIQFADRVSYANRVLLHFTGKNEVTPADKRSCNAYAFCRNTDKPHGKQAALHPAKALTAQSTLI